ncbi:MAG: MBL fold metallo-hydrolase [Planctomycetes bacterium]|nr:MBL fold metallo-hydrolase [Planctomycetota bacterium]
MSVAVLIAAVLLGYRWSTRRGPSARRTQPSSPILQTFPSTLAPGIHILGRLSPGVAYAVETAEGLALIDSGLAADSASLIEQLRELGLDVSWLRIILLTHAHGDHSLGARRLRELSGAKIYAGKDDSPPLRAGAPREAIFANYDMTGFPIHSTPVDVELSGGEVIELGPTRFQAIATPGHTPGSMCYLLKRDDLTALFAGDTVMSMSELGTYSAYLAPRYRGDAQACLRSCRKLLAVPVPDLLLPGHPHNAPEPPSARLTQQQWQGLLEAGIQEMETLVARYQTDGPDFLDGNL